MKPPEDAETCRERPPVRIRDEMEHANRLCQRNAGHGGVHRITERFKTHEWLLSGVWTHARAIDATDEMKQPTPPTTLNPMCREAPPFAIRDTLVNKDARCRLRKGHPDDHVIHEGFAVHCWNHQLSPRTFKTGVACGAVPAQVPVDGVLAAAFRCSRDKGHPGDHSHIVDTPGLVPDITYGWRDSMEVPYIVASVDEHNNPQRPHAGFDVPDEQAAPVDTRHDHPSADDVVKFIRALGIDVTDWQARIITAMIDEVTL